ncbi:MAG: hypothetical protein S4CHLAM81_12920 [Chlamydiales bacterium]|nr:hypothetical protein [Chlamydiales bacterium]MCH9636067.1 hypothetical protein [Chlamydiales bacterium]MCH9703222.1 ABC-2 family transporter protein [Chlamydiota bacterium]
MNFWRTLFATQIKLSLAMRLSFWVKVLLIFVKQGLYVVTWAFFFDRYISVNGWGFAEMLSMYGMVSMSIGIVETFFYGVRDLPLLIETHQLDNYMTQPRNVLLNVILAKGDVTAAAEAIYGMILILISGYLSSPIWILLLLPLVSIGIFSLYLYLSSIAFFLQNSQSFVRELYSNANIVATHPNSAYRGFFKVLTLTLLPTAYLSFFPVEFLRTHAWHYLGISYLGVLIFLGVAIAFFYQGLGRYESSSMISQKY